MVEWKVTVKGDFDVILKKKIENNFFSPPGSARELKLRPFDSESKTTSGCSNSLISKKNHPKQFVFILPVDYWHCLDCMDNSISETYSKNLLLWIPQKYI